MQVAGSSGGHGSGAGSGGGGQVCGKESRETVLQAGIEPLHLLWDQQGLRLGWQELGA